MKTNYLFWLLLLCVVNTFGQDGLIQGTVYGENKVPLKGTTVAVVGKPNTVTNDKQGRFRLIGIL